MVTYGAVRWYHVNIMQDGMHNATNMDKMKIKFSVWHSGCKLTYMCVCDSLLSTMSLPKGPGDGSM